MLDRSQSCCDKKASGAQATHANKKLPQSNNATTGKQQSGNNAGSAKKKAKK